MSTEKEYPAQDLTVDSPLDLAQYCTGTRSPSLKDEKRDLRPQDMIAEHVYQFVSTRAHDMVSHMWTLREYAKQCKHITEFGLRYGMSTFAFITEKPETVISYDLQSWGMEKWLWAYADTMGVDWQDPMGNSCTVKIDPTDLLFIDSEHTYKQLTVELAWHHEKVAKWIICHDTESFAKGPNGEPGLRQAIDEFVATHEWVIERHFELGNGLTVLGREGSDAGA